MVSKWLGKNSTKCIHSAENIEESKENWSIRFAERTPNKTDIAKPLNDREVVQRLKTSE